MDGGSIPLAKLRKLGVATLIRLINGHGLHINPDSGLQSDKLAPILQVLIKHRLQRESVVERAIEKKLGAKKRTAKQKAATERLVAANKERSKAYQANKVAAASPKPKKRAKRHHEEDDVDWDMYGRFPVHPEGIPSMEELLEAFD